MKVKIITLKQLIKILIVAIIAIIIVSIVAAGSGTIISTAGQERKLPIYSVDTDEKLVAISFDAAWGNEDTEELIAILKEHDVKATFFIVGAWVDKYPESVKALAEAGHDIMSHSDTHPHMGDMSVSEALSEIESSNAKIMSITGKKPTLFRAPYGEYCNNLIDALASQNMYCIQWDVDSLDWKDLSAEEITNRVIKNVQCGSIVLFHNAAKNTPEALPTIIMTLKSYGYRFVKISDLIMKDNYKIDNNGKQIRLNEEKETTTSNE